MKKQEPIHFTAEEVETHRLERLATAAAERDYTIAELADHFAPGTPGCHEALHVASMLCDSVDRYICDHPAVLGDPEWYQLASEAQDALFNLYQAIGAKHLGREE